MMVNKKVKKSKIKRQSTSAFDVSILQELMYFAFQSVFNKYVVVPNKLMLRETMIWI